MGRKRKASLEKSNAMRKRREAMKENTSVSSDTTRLCDISNKKQC